MLKWTDKQKEYNEKATHRWNFKVGAVRSGKTFQDKEHIIPKRIRERAGLEGLTVIMGVTQATVERNVLRPMREKFGDGLVGNIIKGTGTVKLFGEECYVLGAEKVNQVSKIQGMSIKYLYADEMAKWSKEVFEMIKSRLDKPYSTADATCNPEQKKHWLKEFLDSDADVYVQHYTIDDNDFLPPEFVENLKKEYAGTIYYNRYILGQWCNAEGLIYTKFANDPKKYIYTKKTPEGKYILPPGDIVVGIDYGGTKSAQAFVCSLITHDCKHVIALASERIKQEIDSKELEDLQVEFIKKIIYKYGKVDFAYPDNEESVHIRSLANRCAREGLSVIVRGSKKEPIVNRIRGLNKMIAFEMFSYIEEDCSTLVEAIESAVWNDKKNSMKDERLDDGTSDIDTMDAFEYTFERYLKNISMVIGDEVNV